MPAPTNTTPATAMALGPLPVTLSIDLSELDPETERLWFSYQAETADVVVGWRAQIGTLEPLSQVWTGPVDALALYLGLSSPDPFQIPVTPGVTYYVGVWLIFPGPLEIAVLGGTNVALPIGTLIINDDVAPFPAAFLSAADGHVMQFRPLPQAGENVAMLRSGLSLWEEEADATVLRLLDDTLTVVASPSVPGRTITAPLASNRTNLFYAAIGSTVRTITTTGAFGATTWHLPTPNLNAIDVSPDEAVLYYTTPGETPVARWNLLTDTALTDVAAGVPGYQTRGVFSREILVLPDGSVLVPYMKDSPPLHSFVRRYSAAGATLHTYDLGIHAVNRLAHDVFDEAGAFWCWMFTRTPAGAETGLSRMQSIRLSDGAVLTTFDTVMYEEGRYSSPSTALAAPLVGPVPFGHAASCPIVIIPFALPPWFGDGPASLTAVPGSYGIGPVDTGGGTTGADATLVYSAAPPLHGTRTSPQRRLRRAPHLTDEARWLFYHALQIDMATGVGLVTGQGSDPQVMLRWSDDGGVTWSDEHWTSAGRMGETRTRVSWHRLGRSRDRVFEVVVSDAVSWFVAACYVEITPGDS